MFSSGVVLAGLATQILDEKLDLSKTIGALSTSNVVSILARVVLFAVPLDLVTRRVRTVTS